MTSPFWTWLYHIARTWRKPRGVTPAELWLAVVIATYGTKGRNCFPSAETLAVSACMSERQVKRLRKRLVEHGVFTETGETRGRVSVLNIAIPADFCADIDEWVTDDAPEGDRWSIPKVTDETARVTNEA